MFTLLLVLFVLIILYWLFKDLNYWKQRNVPGPQPLPFFGNIIQSTLRRRFLSEVYQDIYNQYPQEKVIGIYRMTSPSIMIRDLDIIKDIMIRDFNNFMTRGVEFSSEGLGNNMFQAGPALWTVLRKLFSPIFSSAKIKGMFPIILDQSSKAIKNIENDLAGAKSAELEVLDVTKKFMMANTKACVFGLEVDFSKGQLAALRKIDNLLFSSNIFIEVDMMFPNILRKLNASFFPKSVIEFFRNLVRNVFIQRNGVPTKRKDFMDLMLEMKLNSSKNENKHDDGKTVEVTDDLMASQAFIFYGAGYETSATTSAFLLYELASNPEVQEKVIAEIDKVLSKTDDGKISYENINEMSYLSRVFDETLRMYPVADANAMQRVAMNDYKIAGTNITIPKGTVVVVSLKGIHNDPQYYPNPHVFDPDRFLPENSGERHSCAYMPFGTGPRNCVGLRFGRIQTLSLIASLLSKFRVEPTASTPARHNLKFSTERVVLCPAGSLYLNFVRRS